VWNGKKMDAQATSDEALARRVKAGDPAAFTELDRRYRARLLLLLRRRVGCVHDAEDLTQQALARAYEKIDQYDDRRAFRPWLFTLAIRLAIDLQRRPDHRAVREPWRDEARGDEAPDPRAEAEAAEQRSVVWSIIDRVLDGKQRALLWLYYVEELPPRQIGKALSMSAVNVRVSLHRARKALAPHVAHLCHESEAAGASNPAARPAPALTLAGAGAEGEAT
jgi:RNA polymerase sigma-70 factor (ECF subfamily)